MAKTDIKTLFNLTGKVIAITGGSGVLGSDIACALTEVGSNVAILDLKTELSDDVKQRLDAASGNYEVFQCNVLERNSIESCLNKIIQ